MATITLGNVDEDLLAQVSRRASQTQRSVEDEIKELIKLGLSARADRERLVMAADAIAALTPPGHQTDSIDLLREERSR